MHAFAHLFMIGDAHHLSAMFSPACGKVSKIVAVSPA
jgi:hypothetical protein